MDDAVLVASVGLVFMFLLVAYIGRRKAYTPSTKWRKAVSGSLWALNAMLSGGVASPKERGKAAYVRKRDDDEEGSRT